MNIEKKDSILTAIRSNRSFFIGLDVMELILLLNINRNILTANLWRFIMLMVNYVNCFKDIDNIG